MLVAFAGVYAIAGSPLALVVLGLQVLFARRRSWWLIALQAAAAYGSVFAFGSSVGILGFVAGSLLLTRLWPLAPAVAGSAVLLGPADPVISMVLVTLVIYGLATMVDRIEEVTAARLSLAMTAAAEERLRIAAELSKSLGSALDTIATSARAGTPDVETARRSLSAARAAATGYRAMSLGPELTTAKAMLVAAGVATEVRMRHAEPLGPAGALLAAVLREAVTEIVRRRAATRCVIETVTDDDTVRLSISHDGSRSAADESLADLPEQVAAAGGTLTTGIDASAHVVVEVTLPATRLPAAPAPSTRLSTALLAAVLIGFSVKGLLLAGSWWPAPLLLVIVVIHLRSIEGRRMPALAVLAVLALAPIPVFGEAWLGTTGFLAGPILLALRLRVAVPLVAALMAVVAVAGVLIGLPYPLAVNYTVSTLVTGLVVYGLVTLARLDRELSAARDGLARSVVVVERLRAARDLHDLLGHTLAAILLKSELARRLEPDLARAELDDVLAMTEQAMTDLRTVSGERGTLSLAGEADSARSVLTAAGIDASVELGHGTLGAEVETALGVVLREAVTNVLRHSSARHCTISTSERDGEVRLTVRNDGAQDKPVRPPDPARLIRPA
ncbi:two-component sensor histidine kinase [Nonomuraea sp. MG754425]|uniref:sensor histidine kinase n=1 Tax=Nonomuraea sp. MG754425 TaxID=2570319 RepID=UPI0027DF537A|nr:histidine kinase [Nonomuraea sp. MG754425]MCF6470843.1 two-component sensor histidine kinase [Nonomuraea sp. MG754425]